MFQHGISHVWFVVVSKTMNSKPISNFQQTLDPELRQSIQAEQFRMMMALTTPATVMATLFAILTTAFFHQQGSNALVAGWLLMKVGIAVPRIAQQQLHRLLGSPSSPAWVRSALLLLFIDGTVWGLAAIWLPPTDDLITLILISVGLAGVAAVATFTLHANWVGNAAYCVPMVLPAALQLLLREDAIGLYAGAGLLVFIGSLLSVAWRAQKHTIEMLRLRFTTDRIVREREEALQLAERQNQVKSQFVATMSHELRTPLHGILGLIRMIQSDQSQLNSENRRRLGLVERSGEHLLSIINDILDFSRMEAGHLSTEHQAFDLRELLDDLVALSSVTAIGKGLSLSAAIDLPTPCWVKGDGPRVRQILLNLIGNAVKFTEQGSICLSAKRQACDVHTDPPIMMTVADSGIGIAKDELAHIFDAFHQADSSLGRRFGGTGLGLTISREMSRSMQGEITCSSTLGQGSVFAFMVPLPPAPGSTLSNAAESQQASAHPAPPKLQGHILLAEDNEVNAMVVEALLLNRGLTVEHVGNGTEALHRLLGSAPRPDLVLMDCQMPTMDGLEATRLIREDERRRGLPRLPVIALTASALTEDSERCLLAGMDAHLSKPFREDQLFLVLAAHLPPTASATRGRAHAELTAENT